jgi:DNA-binding MarR family transcriptional regulator
MKPLPLPTLLSHALVAFIIEFDNEFEHRTPHRTTRYGATPGSHRAPFLLSMVIWSGFLRFVPDEGISVGEFQHASQLPRKNLRIWLARMSEWWGYVTLEPSTTEDRSAKGSAGWVIRPTPGGRKALECWRPLTGVIEERWQARLGRDAVEKLRDSLSALVSKFEVDLPDFLPILGYGLRSGLPDQQRRASSDRTLPTLFSKVLLAFAIEFERESELALAICANVLRLVNNDGVPVRELPRLAGVSKEAIAIALSFLEKRGYANVEPLSAASRTKVLKLTAKGLAARQSYEQLVQAIEERWHDRFGRNVIAGLRAALEWTDGVLFRGLDPYPDCWRAAVPRPEGLPHYPMILHRGGFPDGS